MKEICVVHLIYPPLGIEFFKRFVISYETYATGVEHDLLLALKGGFTGSDYARYIPASAGVIRLPAEGHDLADYKRIVELGGSQYTYFCFLNSYSYLLCNDWLSKMYAWIMKAKVGLVGATGSWESSPDLPEFPNYHIRTNGFMIRGEDFLACTEGVDLSSKFACNQFEAGNHSLTRKMLATGKEVRMVGRDGTGYEKDMWHVLDGFRSGEQANLLIGDNRTDHYQYGDKDVRKFLNNLAWGIQ